MKTLSDKIENCMCEKYNCGYKKLRTEDVKEFIKELKKSYGYTKVIINGLELREIIDKLAGDKLT